MSLFSKKEPVKESLIEVRRLGNSCAVLKDGKFVTSINNDTIKRIYKKWIILDMERVMRYIRQHMESVLSFTQLKKGERETALVLLESYAMDYIDRIERC